MQVRVGEVEAVVANNAFMAEASSRDGPIVLTTPNGERVVPGLGAPPPASRPTSRSAGRGYVGLVEYAWSGYPTLEIDDLDSASWQGNPTGALLVNANAPDVWFVGVVLLEGPRAGELATANLVVQRDENGKIGSVRFSGRTPFAPHPDPPRLDAAQRRLAELRQRPHLQGPH